uniref:ubiquitinyl hydrolase 1 n=1 Tax=Panagrellus redivivus TaxID=6233 RepID=A0A7E4ZVP9_PANRE
MSSEKSNPSELASLPEETAAQVSADETLAQQLANHEQAMYEQNQLTIQSIEEDIRNTQALVGKKLTLQEGLINEYVPETSPEYYHKAIDLSHTYSHIRKIRGDGNCFYRAVLTTILERVLEHRDELEPLITLVKSWRARLLAFGFPELTTGDFCDAMETLLESIRDNLKNESLLLDDLNQESIANYYVAFLRLIASGFLNENEDTYAGFIEGGRTLKEYCREEIEPMWKDCDHMSILALVNALATSLRIVYMDRSQAPDGGWHHDILADNVTGEPKLILLFRPGHYDLLYRKSAPGST